MYLEQTTFVLVAPSGTLAWGVMSLFSIQSDLPSIIFIYIYFGIWPWR